METKAKVIAHLTYFDCKVCDKGKLTNTCSNCDNKGYYYMYVDVKKDLTILENVKEIFK